MRLCSPLKKMIKYEYESGTVAVKPSSKEEKQNYLKFHCNVSYIYLALRVTWYIVKISFIFLSYLFYFVIE